MMYQVQSAEAKYVSRIVNLFVQVLLTKTPCPQSMISIDVQGYCTYAVRSPCD